MKLQPYISGYSTLPGSQLGHHYSKSSNTLKHILFGPALDNAFPQQKALHTICHPPGTAALCHHSWHQKATTRLKLTLVFSSQLHWVLGICLLFYCARALRYLPTWTALHDLVAFCTDDCLVAFIKHLFCSVVAERGHSAAQRMLSDLEVLIVP